ncbi:MAG: response regulator [Candidatus Zixiibacteriota bacterium]
MSKKVLVVDDEEIIRRTLRINLAQWGYEAEEASDGDQALEALDGKKVDLLILDILMPKKNGWEVLREVRSNPKTREMPVIVLTAKNEDVDMFKGYELGASYYITKPFTKAQLLYGIQLVFEGNSESPPVVGQE